MSLGAFIALPGDTGTLEEVPEVISLIALAQFDAPCILFNLNGFYGDLRASQSNERYGTLFAVQAAGYPFRRFA